MADQDNPEPEDRLFFPVQKAHKGEDRSVWWLSRDDQRLLWITFAGGLASILVGAGLIGLAITFARHWSSSPGLEFATLSFAIGAAGGFGSSRAKYFPGNRSPLLYKLLFGVCLAGLCFVALIWVGVAAGVK